MKWLQRAFSRKHISRKTLKIIAIFALCLAAGLELLPSAHAQTRIYDFPLGGTCYEVCVVTNSHGSTHTTLVPYPFCPIDPSFTPLYSVDDAGICIFAGPGATWSQLQAARDEILYWESQSGLYGIQDDGGTGGYTDADFYLELTSVDTTNGFANLLLHATVSNELYQLEFKTNIDQPDWTLSQTLVGAADTTPFLPEAINGNPQMFFRAHHADVIVSVVAVQNGIETNSVSGDPGQPGIIRFEARGSGFTNDVTVRYKISGVASNGQDYTNISGVVTIPQSIGSNDVFIQPIEHHDLDFDESVTLTPFRTNTYLIRPEFRSATIVIHDNFGTNIFSVVASGFNLPTGVDYDPATNSLIVAVNGGGNNFWRIDTNGIVTSWSTVTQNLSEVKFAIVKQTANGFTNGQIYFDTDESFASIGRISTDGSSWTNNWATLFNDNSVQGGFYVDQSGVFDNDLIAVTGSGDGNGASVWQIKANGDATNLVFFPQQHFEGVITLTNDVARWGPWAGKILTGSETGLFSPNRNLIRAIDSSGSVSNFDLGIISLGTRSDNAGHDDGLSTEHFDIIPPNQDFYLVAEGTGVDDGRILKLSHIWLTNYVGDLLITQGGRYVGEPEMYIVHWNGSDFISRGIPLQYYSRNTFSNTAVVEIEGACFAPTNFPSQ